MSKTRLDMNENGETIVYLAVHDTEYPRNRFIREQLSLAAYSIVVIPRPTLGSFINRTLSLLRIAWRPTASANAIILSEFAIEYIFAALILSWCHRTPLIVDAFVGLRETRDGDKTNGRRFGVKSLAYAVADATCSAARMVLTDTEAHARTLSLPILSRARWYVIPVGAPPWAIPTEQPPSSKPRAEKLRILFYGNYLSLHGIEFLLQALDDEDLKNAVSLTTIGTGPTRPLAEAIVLQRGLSGCVTFLEPVAPRSLRQLINNADLVAGTFGKSRKADVVIANKVWQALACGRPVLTARNAASSEIPEEVRSMILAVESGSPQSIRATLLNLVEGRIELPESIAHPEYFVARHRQIGMDEFVTSLGSITGRRHGRMLQLHASHTC